MIGEVWLESDSSGKQGECLEQMGVCGILGAGNYEGPLDILTKMFCENKVVIYKPNPINEANASILKKVMVPLIDAGYLRIVIGGSEIGGALVHHPQVDEILMTGGAASYDRIMWGSTTAEIAENKRTGHKLLNKPFEAELGAVSPVIVTPGEWTLSEINHMANHLAAAKLTNSGHICASPQIIVVDKDWPQRKQFLEALQNQISKVDDPTCYYPGAMERCSTLKQEYGQSVELGNDSRHVKILCIPDADKNSKFTKEEVFAPAYAEINLECGNDPAVFLKNAVDYCNDSLYGTLSCTLIVDPRTQAKLKDDVQDAIMNLKYGAIGVNVWGLVSMFHSLPWGAYPGHTEKDIQSGQGKILIHSFWTNHKSL